MKKDAKGFVLKFLGVVLVLAGGISPANAIPIQYKFETQVDVSAFGGSANETLRFDYTADTDTIGAPNLSNSGLFYDTTLTVTLGAESVSKNFGIFVLNDSIFGSDLLGFSSANGGYTGTLLGNNVSNAGFELFDDTGTALSNNNLVSNIDFSAFSGIRTVLAFDGFSNLPLNTGNIPVANVNFNFSTVTSAVPEPATLSLLGLGFAGMLFTKRRKRSFRI